MSDAQYRFDSIWRRTRPDAYASKLEGKFRESTERLRELNNWGSLAWLYPHATATKLAHHYGVEHNAQHFLDADPIRERYRPSFRIASHALHWGHLPLSYAGAEGLVRAAHVEPKVRKVLESVLKDVVNFGSLDCEADGHVERCYDAVLDGDRPFELYKWLSAWLVAKRWSAIWKVAKSLSPPEISEEETKKEAIRTLVCREDFGYQLLDLCRLADYVPRDLQQAGTAWLSVDIEALWEVSPLRPDRAPEWSLLQAAKSYLEDRFFHSPEAQLIHSLAGRVIAQTLMNHGINRESLLALLTNNSGDAHYLSPTFSEYHRRRLRTVQAWAKGESLDRVWWHVGTFENVSLPNHSRLEAEDQFSKRTGSGQLSYPFAAHFSVVVERQGDLRPAEVTRRQDAVALILHHREDKDESPARPTLDIALRAQWLQRFPRNREQSGDGIAGWLLKGRAEARPMEVRRAAGALLRLDDKKAAKLLGRVGEQAIFDPERDPGRRRAQFRRLFSFELRDEPLGRAVLALPYAAVNSKPGTELLELLRNEGGKAATNGEKSRRGSALEAAAAADQLLSSDECVQRVLILGATALSEEGKTTAEWDILRLDLLKGGDWRVIATECSVTQNNQKEEDERARLDQLRDLLQERFIDLAQYRTKLVTVSEGSLKYKDAGRNFDRDQ